TGQHVQDRGFPAAARPEQAHELATTDLERDVGRRDDRLTGGAAGDGEVAQLELRHRLPQLRGGRDVRHQRNLNFSAISICTTLPSCTTSTTVPNDSRRKIAPTLASTARSSSVRSSDSRSSAGTRSVPSLMAPMLRLGRRGSI